MFDWLIGDWRTVALVALSTLAVYLFASAAVRTSERRTLAEMSAFDFVVAVAIGAIVGRTATASSTSVVQGCVAILVLVAAHRLVGWIRLRWPGSQDVVDHDPVVLVVDGEICEPALEQAALTERDVLTVLRQKQIRSVDDVELLVLERSGRFSVYRRSEQPLDPRLTDDLSADDD